jgi:hypothetical protein
MLLKLIPHLAVNKVFINKKEGYKTLNYLTMKTKYIKGTNKKYSIREDGVVFINYYLRNNVKKYYNDIKILKPRKDNLVKINRKRMSLMKLLRDHFNIFYCKHCNKKKKIINDDQSVYVCKKCQKKQLIIVQKEWRNRNLELSRERSRLDSKKNRDNLTDRYIIKSFKIKVIGNIHKELIELKRNQLKLHRELKKQKQNDTN